MDSPYNPGFGARPAVLVGREVQLARVEAMLARVRNAGEASPAHLVFTGARGLGKTVTLSVAGERATDRAFMTAAVAMDPVSDNVQMLAAAVAEAVAPLQGRHAAASSVWTRLKERLSALSIELNAGVVRVASDAPVRAAAPAVQRQVLAALLIDAAQLARDAHGTGLVLLIDELQEAPYDDLVVLANAIQDAAKTARVPLCVVAAGLPQTPDLVMAAASFTERFDFRVLGRLDEVDAERALLEPALAVGVRWEPAAAEEVLHAAGGSPYLIQYIGDETWTYANPGDGSSIALVSVIAALEEVRGNLEAGMFRGRWSKTTPAERAVIVAIAQAADERGVATTPAVSGLLDANAARWSMARQSLVDKGLVEATGRGRLRFTMPGFAAFVTRLTDNDTPQLLVDDATFLPPATRTLGPIDPHAALSDPAPTARPPDEASPDDSLHVRGDDEATPALDDLEPEGP